MSKGSFTETERHVKTVAMGKLDDPKTRTALAELRKHLESALESVKALQAAVDPKAHVV